MKEQKKETKKGRNEGTKKQRKEKRIPELPNILNCLMWTVDVTMALHKGTEDFFFPFKKT